MRVNSPIFLIASFEFSTANGGYEIKRSSKLFISSSSASLLTASSLINIEIRFSIIFIDGISIKTIATLKTVLISAIFTLLRGVDINEKWKKKFSE